MPGTYKRKDHLYEKAKDEGYRSRAAYKLKELNEKHRLIQQGMTVVDLGCFPGGWLQGALEAVGSSGKVIGVDLREVERVSVGGREAVIIKGDLFDSAIRLAVIEAAGGRADVILSDLSPQLSGVRFRDAVRSAELVELALDIAGVMLKKHGALVTKIFPGAECDQLAGRFKKLFRNFGRASLKSSRKSSTEIYFVARDYLGAEAEEA